MTFYSFIPLVALFFALFILGHVASLNWTSKVNRAFLLYAGSVALWLLDDFLLWSNVIYINPMGIIRSFAPIWFATSFLFLNFIYHLIERKRDFCWWGFFVFWLICSCLFLFTDYLITGYEVHYWGVQSSRTPLFAVVNIINYFVPTGIGLFLLWRNVRHDKKSLKRKHFFLLLVGTFITIMGGLLLGIVLPNILGIQKYPFFASEIALVQLMFVFFAIVRYRFLSMGSEEVAEDIFASIRDIVLILSEEGCIISHNGAARSFFALPAAEIVGKKIGHFLPDLNNLILTSLHSSHECRYQEKNIIFTLSEIGNVHYARGFILIGRDVTDEYKHEKERKEMQAQLFLTTRLASLGTLSAGLAHELNNPLTIILGFIERVQKRPLVQEDLTTKEMLAKIQQAAGRMKRIVQHLRTIARSDNEDQSGPVQLAHVVRESFSFFDRLLTNEEITVRLENMDGQFPAVLANYAQIESILHNFISNSRDAFMSHPEIKERTIVVQLQENKKRQEVVLIFKDNAGGIPREVEAQIFQPFFTTKEIGKGTGLGLSIVQKIVLAHKGKLDVRNCYGEGVAFVITFPSLPSV